MDQLTSDQNKMLVSLLHLRSKQPFQHKSSAMFQCPFHKDKTPSLSINFESGEWHCFSCGRGGFMNSLCKERVGKTSYELLGITKSSFHLMAKPSFQEYSFNLEDKIKADEAYEADTNLDIRGAVRAYYQEPDAQRYLEIRGIARREATSMQMKYVKEAYCNGTYFKQRLVVPIYNKDGNLINIEARDVTKQQAAKCLYPRGSIKTIYEHYKLDKTKPLYIVEGLMDLAVLRSDDFFANSSAIFGVQVTEYQFRLLDQFPEVILIPDNDEAGRQSIQLLRSRLGRKFSTLKIGSSFIKDVGEIPEYRTTVKDFREAGNFLREH